MAAKTERIQDPANYLLGIPKPALSIPDNIILFHRHPDKLQHPPFLHAYQNVLVISLRGAGDVVLNNRIIHLEPGNALLILAGQLHCYRNIHDTTLTWLYITFRIATPDALAALRNRTTPMSARSWRLAETVADDYLALKWDRSSGSSGICMNLWLLLMELLRAHDRQIPLIEKQYPSTRARAHQIEQYIMDHLHEPIRLRDLARHVNMSVSGLKEFAHKVLSQTPGRYIRNRRVALAYGLMRSPDLTFSEIAAQCGFSGIYAFSRTFKQIMKVSPNEYRARLRSRRSHVLRSKVT